MYGLLLESVRFYIKQKHGQDVWEKICQNSGLSSTVFGTVDNYSDTIIPRLSESCSKCLPCGLPANTYMEIFGNCFVDFTSTMGYSKVLKVYGRSFRDFLDNIDSLHEHLRFGFPRLMSPSFECNEETSDGLTLHYRSRRFGYKNYVIGQVKEVAKLYFNMDIDVKILGEADIVTSYGVRRCHVTFRVIFNNSGFMPLVKEHKMFSSLSVPVDLIFSISPFSFLINKDLKIFRASNDLNQYFGENMAGKKVAGVFIVRRPPIELTWETLINHGRVMFELVARQASNISLFTDPSNGENPDLSAKKLEWIEKFKKLDIKADFGKMNSKHKSKSADFGRQLAGNKGRVVGTNHQVKRSSSLQLSLDKPSKGILMQRKAMAKGRSFTVSTLSSDSSEKIEFTARTKTVQNGGLLDGDYRREDGDQQNASFRLSLPHCVEDLTGCDLVVESPSHDFVRPEPIGKQNTRDLSPSNSTTRITSQSVERSLPNNDVDNAVQDVPWFPSRNLHRPEPIGQEDETKSTAIVAGSSGVNMIVQNAAPPSKNCKQSNDLSCEHAEKGNIFTVAASKETIPQNTQRCSKHREKARDKVKVFTAKENTSVFRKMFQKGKVRSLTTSEVQPANQNCSYDDHNDKSSGIDTCKATIITKPPGNRASTDKEGAKARRSSQQSLENKQTLCSTGLFDSLRRSIANVRLACFPPFSVRNIRVASAETSINDCKAAPKSPQFSVKKSRPNRADGKVAFSDPVTRKILPETSPSKFKISIHENTKTDPFPRRKVPTSGRSSTDQVNIEEKRKKVAMWLQRQQCRPLLLRGQIKYITSWNMVLFIGTPLIGTVDDLLSSGLYLSDLSMHDGSRSLTMTGTQRLSEIEFACDREKLKRDLLEETTRKLGDEKRRTEELLYSMMPREIAERMKNGDRELTTCETFDDVTILFGYVNDFTEICNKVEAMKVVQLVSEVFSLFDILSENHKVYKFETIGGGVYMLVSGVPVKIDEHAKEMALMALEMLEQVQTLQNPHTNRSLELQIGIHSGSVVAGVIGQATLQYCLFGNTVNIASRMQTTGSKMKIHLSEATNRELGCSEFITEYRGKVPVKGIGDLNTYWLIGKKNSDTLNNNNCVKEMKQCTLDKTEIPSGTLALT